MAGVLVTLISTFGEAVTDLVGLVADFGVCVTAFVDEVGEFKPVFVAVVGEGLGEALVLPSDFFTAADINIFSI